MADDRLLVRYFANAARGDGNDRIRLAADPETGQPRELHRDGDPVLITLEEYNKIAQYWSVAVVDENGEKVQDADVPEAAEAASVAPPTTAGAPVRDTSTSRDESASSDAARSPPSGTGETAQTDTNAGSTRSPTTPGR